MNDSSLPVHENFDGEAIIAQIHEVRQRIQQQIGRVIIGQSAVVEELLIALFSGGHCLFVGVPGLAKTLLISTLADALSLKFNRIQFTPDLMPSDITGTDILEEDPSTGRRRFRFVQGPIFANIVLADEINRTPPKTQAALLQAMQEHQVSASGQTYPLPSPFLVFATQNPIEQEGTYPLPEAQLDRFMFFIGVEYPSADEEAAIVAATTGSALPRVEPVIGPEELMQAQEMVRKVPVTDTVVRYAVTLARASRPHSPDAPPFIRDWVSWGAGPRAGQFLILGAKTRALLQGRPAPSMEDVRALARSVLRHRISLNYRAEAEGATPLQVIERLLAEVPTP